jgi:hypothetical protein
MCIQVSNSVLKDSGLGLVGSGLANVPDTDASTARIVSEDGELIALGGHHSYQLCFLSAVTKNGASISERSNP